MTSKDEQLFRMNKKGERNEARQGTTPQEVFHADMDVQATDVSRFQHIMPTFV